MPATPALFRRSPLGDGLPGSGVDLDERDALPSPEEFSVVTTTIFAGGSSATAGPTIESNSSSNSIPLAPIIGGAVGGVCLALIVVMGWMWWGSCIRRRDAEKRKEEMAHLAVRANTRRNASSFSAPTSQYQPSSKLSSAGRKVKFASAGGSGEQTVPDEKNASSPAVPLMSNPTPVEDDSTIAYNDVDDSTPSHTPPRKPSPPPITQSNRYMLTRKPKTPSKLSWSIGAPTAKIANTSETTFTSTPLTIPEPSSPSITSPFHDDNAVTSPTPPPVAATNSNQSQPSTYSTNTLPQYPFLREIPGRSHQQHSFRAPSLAHKPSAVSSDSWYSTQSGEERRKLGSRRFFDSIVPRFDPNRLSTFSKSSGGSVYSTLD